MQARSLACSSHQPQHGAHVVARNAAVAIDVKQPKHDCERNEQGKSAADRALYLAITITERDRTLVLIGLAGVAKDGERADKVDEDDAVIARSRQHRLDPRQQRVEPELAHVHELLERDPTLFALVQLDKACARTD